MSARPHYVYRCYDADDRLLYVGCTVHVARRMSGHRRDPRTIASRVLNLRMRRYEIAGPYVSREVALAAESAAIRDEAPLLNFQQSGEPMYLRWGRVARYLEALEIPIKSADLGRCSDCEGAIPRSHLRCGRCQDCHYMHRRELRWDEVPA